MIKNIPNFWIKTKDLQLIESAFDLCLKLGYDIDKKDYDDIKGIGIFTRINDTKDINNISYEKPKLLLIYNGDRDDGINGTNKNGNLIDLINDYQSNLDEYCQYLKNSLYALLEKYPKFIIGQEIRSEVYLKIPELNTLKFIKEYSEVNGQWLLRTNTGWSFFENTLTKEDYILKYNMMIKKKQKRIKKGK